MKRKKNSKNNNNKYKRKEKKNSKNNNNKYKRKEKKIVKIIIINIKEKVYNYNKSYYILSYKYI